MANRKKAKGEKKFNKELSLAIGAETERFGRAALEHLKAHPELQKIAQSRIHPDYKETNIQQQAGKSAEVKEVSRTNADNIINRKSARIARTDNVGAVNHPKYDTVAVDSDGKPLQDSYGNYIGGTQQKNFANVKSYEKLYGKDYEHYKDTRIVVPKDQYNQIVKEWDDEINHLKQGKVKALQREDHAKANQIQEKIDRIEDTKCRMDKSMSTTADAREALLNPTLSTAKDVLDISHKAGMSGAGYGAAIGGSINMVGNIASGCKGDKDLDEAMIDIVKSTGKSAVVGYGSGFAISAIGATLRNQKNALIQNLGKGSGPVAILNAGKILVGNIIKLSQGKLNGEEFILSMTQESATLASSMSGASIGAAVGSVILPGIGTVIGSVIGGMLCSILVNSMFGQLQNTIMETKLSNQQREFIRAYCEILRKQEQDYPPLSGYMSPQLS